MSSKIRLKQGEAKTITFTVTRAYGQAVDLTGATLFLGVKRHKSDTAYIFSKVDADFDKTQQALGIVDVRCRKVVGVEDAVRKGIVTHELIRSPFRCAPGAPDELGKV